MEKRTEGRSAIQHKGLTSEEVIKQRAKFGSNILTPPPREPLWRQFLEKFDDPMVRILIIAAVLATIVGIAEGEYYEGIGIVIAIILATTIAFYNEFKAGKEFDVLNRSSDEKPIKAYRDGQWTEVERKDLVVGDVVEIEQGYEIPADGRVLESVSFQVDQAVLTGESAPVTKMPEEEAQARGVASGQYLRYKVYRGTKVSEGVGIVEIEQVGDGTEWGKLGKEISEEVEGKSPLDHQLEMLSKWIGVLGFGMAALIFFSLLIRDTAATGKFVLSGQQWVFSALLLVSVAIALARVWLPIFYDAFELTGHRLSPPKWLEDETLVGWVKVIVGGFAFFLLGVGICYLGKWIPESRSEWISKEFGLAILEYFMIAVTIIVVAVPEGLAMSVTLSLAYSMRRMMKTGTLVRKMNACETIGATTVICSDKTGTLTMNEMQAHEVVSPCPNAESCGQGGLFECQHSDHCRDLFLEALSANTTAHLERRPGERARAIGNPTEGALLLWLESEGMDYLTLRESFQMEQRLPFDTKRKYMTTVGISEVDSSRRLHVKGAPEIVLERCDRVFSESGIRPLSDEEKGQILELLETFQRRGFRTLGFGFKDLEAPIAQEEIERESTGLVWLRFVAIEDPIREEVPSAIEVCHRAGIEVKVVTGDHPETAEEIARQIGLIVDEGLSGQHVSGTDFEKMTDEEAEEAARRLRIMSRAKPEHKKRLVEKLRGSGHVVAVSGDGVNDAPALHNANVALAMGSGTDVAKEVSQIVLLNDSFATIKTAVMWGRALYQNIQRFIVFQLTVSGAALGVAFLGPFIGVDIPLTVVQLLWVNLIMDTFAALALATEPPHEDVMRRGPRDPESFIVSREMGKWIFGFGILFVALMILALLHMKRDGVTPRELSLFFAFFVMLQFWNMFNARVFGLKQSAFTGLFKNAAFAGIAGAILVGTILMVQIGGEVFRTQPLTAVDWLITIAVTSPVLWIGEIVRLLSRSKVAQTA